MKCHVVIDTNVLVSALLSRNNESATVQLLERLLKLEVIPIYSEDIIQEYWEVLNRPKFNFSQELVRWLLETVVKYGKMVETAPIDEVLPDKKDLPFYEVVMETREEQSYLVTGNLKHFPIRPYIVTARQMLEIIDGQ